MAFFFLFFYPFFSFFFSVVCVRSVAEQSLNAHTMHIPKFQTFNCKNTPSQFEFYVLSKGLNSGKPLEKPCPNSFVCICQNQEQKDFYFWLLFGLWKSNYFHHFLTGSVIPFIRIGEFKKVVAIQAVQVSQQQQAYNSTINKIKLLEQKEKEIRQSLALISDLKKAMLYSHLKR
jgi:hypothetical protein